jgi:hypothetical protein
MSTVASRFGSWRRWVLGLGPIGLALFQPMTAREFSFSLSATDSDVWRVWAVASLVSLG